jgi:hypothetical protein
MWFTERVQHFTRYIHFVPAQQRQRRAPEASPDTRLAARPPRRPPLAPIRAAELLQSRVRRSRPRRAFSGTRSTSPAPRSPLPHPPNTRARGGLTPRDTTHLRGDNTLPRSARPKVTAPFKAVRMPRRTPSLLVLHGAVWYTSLAARQAIQPRTHQTAAPASPRVCPARSVSSW